MIIECKSCLKKFVVNDLDIPKEGRMVQCGYCSQKWFQAPIIVQSSIKSDIDKNIAKKEFEASDGRVYRHLGSQWAEILHSGKTGALAKRTIGAELNRRAGIVKPKKNRKRTREIENETEIDSISIFNPSSKQVDDKNGKKEKKLSSAYEEKKGLGFFGFIFLLIIIALCAVGILKTFQNELLMYFPETEYIFESMNNMVIIIKDLIKSY